VPALAPELVWVTSRDLHEPGPASASAVRDEEPLAMSAARGRSRGPAARGAGVIVLLLALWQVASSSGVVNPEFASSPGGVAGAAWDLLSSGSFWSVQAAATVRGFLAGWILAVVVGVLLGLVMGLVAPVREALEPLLMAFYATPHIALIPLLIVWFGFGFEYKLVVVFLAAVFSVLLNTTGAVRSADDQLQRMSRSFGAGRGQVVVSVVLPQARSQIMTGIRLSVIHGLVGIVIGEMLSSQQGIGFLISQAAQLGRTDQLFALVVMLAAAGVTANTGLAGLQARMERWRAG
jgi:ABC-type nitrate/sulfonate/bicarbonate transport system permease component